MTTQAQDEAPPRAPLDTSAGYQAELARIKSARLAERLHYFAHDPRIPAGVLRTWALSYLRWRAGDIDRHGTPVEYPAPPSASIPGVAGADALEAIAQVEAVCREALPNFRPRALRAMARELPPTPPRQEAIHR